MDILRQACEFLAPVTPGVTAVTTSANAATSIRAETAGQVEQFITLICSVRFYIKFGSSTVGAPDETNTGAPAPSDDTDTQCWEVPADTMVSFVLRPGQTHMRLKGSAAGNVRWYLSSV